MVDEERQTFRAHQRRCLTNEGTCDTLKPKCYNTTPVHKFTSHNKLMHECTCWGLMIQCETKTLQQKKWSSGVQPSSIKSGRIRRLAACGNMLCSIRVIVRRPNTSAQLTSRLISRGQNRCVTLKLRASTQQPFQNKGATQLETIQQLLEQATETVSGKSSVPRQKQNQVATGVSEHGVRAKVYCVFIRVDRAKLFNTRCNRFLPPQHSHVNMRVFPLPPLPPCNVSPLLASRSTFFTTNGLRRGKTIELGLTAAQSNLFLFAKRKGNVQIPRLRALDCVAQPQPECVCRRRARTRKD